MINSQLILFAVNVGHTELCYSELAWWKGRQTESQSGWIFLSLIMKKLCFQYKSCPFLPLFYLWASGKAGGINTFSAPSTIALTSIYIPNKASPNLFFKQPKNIPTITHNYPQPHSSFMATAHTQINTVCRSKPAVNVNPQLVQKQRQQYSHRITSC